MSITKRDRRAKMVRKIVTWEIIQVQEGHLNASRIHGLRMLKERVIMGEKR